MNFGGLTGGVKSVSREPVELHFCYSIERSVPSYRKHLTFIHNFVVDADRVRIVRPHNQLVQMRLFVFERLFNALSSREKKEKSILFFRSPNAEHEESLLWFATVFFGDGSVKWIGVFEYEM